MPDIREPNKKLVLLNTHYQIAQCYYAIGDYWESLSYCQDFIYLDPTYRDPYFLMAENYLRLQITTLADASARAGFHFGIKHNNWVETANSWLGWGQHILGVTNHNLGNYDDSIKFFQQALEHEPDNIELLHQYNSVLQLAYNALKQPSLEKID